MKTQVTCMFCGESFAARRKNAKRCRRCRKDAALPTNQTIGGRVRRWGALRMAVHDVREMAELAEDDARCTS